MIDDNDFFAAYDTVSVQMEKWVSASKVFLFNVRFSLSYSPCNYLLNKNINDFKNIINDLEKISSAFKEVHQPLIKCKLTEQLYMYDCYKEKIETLNSLITEHRVLLGKHEIIKNNLETYKLAEAEGIILNTDNNHNGQVNEFLSVIFASAFEPFD